MLNDLRSKINNIFQKNPQKTEKTPIFSQSSLIYLEKTLQKLHIGETYPIFLEMDMQYIITQKQKDIRQKIDKAIPMLVNFPFESDRRGKDIQAKFQREFINFIEAYHEEYTQQTKKQRVRKSDNDYKTYGKLAILAALKENDGLTTSVLVDTIQMSKRGTTKVTPWLEDQGYIRREKCGKFQHHYITDDGHKYLEKAVLAKVNTLAYDSCFNKERILILKSSLMAKNPLFWESESLEDFSRKGKNEDGKDGENTSLVEKLKEAKRLRRDLRESGTYAPIASEMVRNIPLETLRKLKKKAESKMLNFGQYAYNVLYKNTFARRCAGAAKKKLINVQQALLDITVQKIVDRFSVEFDLCQKKAIEAMFHVINTLAKANNFVAGDVEIVINKVAKKKFTPFKWRK